jgi:3-phenylpropionate/trans-cinnamate dioxygenase ferredoxin subunit
VDVSAQGEFGPGQARLIDMGNTRVAVYNLGGEYFALEDLCTHAGFSILGCGLDAADIVQGEAIMCPRHGARFSIRTGEALTPPAFEPLRTFTVRIENGVVQIRHPDAARG